MSRRPTKYRSRPTTTLGERFPSLLEAHVYHHLLLLQKAGAIRELKRQTKVLLCCDIRWTVDFSFIDMEVDTHGLDQLTYAEAKGFEVADYVLKRKLWTAFGHGPLWIFKRSGKGVKHVETIVPDRAHLGRADLVLTEVGP